MCSADPKKNPKNRNRNLPTSAALERIDKIKNEYAFGTVWTWESVFDSIERFYEKNENEILKANSFS